MRRSLKYRLARRPGGCLAAAAVSLIVALLLTLSPLPVRAQVVPAYMDYTRKSLSWYTIETEHFEVHFHMDEEDAGPSRTAQVVSRVAEDIYQPITSLYGREPDSKVHIVLKDYEDYSNGAAYFFDNVIHIWAPALDTPLRGTHDWLRNVITHEFTHMVQVQASMKAGRKMPFIYFQVLTYEDVKRPDVLYGYPDGIVSYPVPVVSNPAWLAEGTAQFQRAGLDYDTWDSHRDMLLRTRVLAGEELSLADMGGFYSHNGLERETVYNQGFAFSRFIAREYGEEALADVTAALGAWSNFNFERAAADALGRNGEDVYRDWVDTLRIAYESAAVAIREAEVDGERLEPDGFLNLLPRFSPDGSRVAYLSNRGGDYSRLSLHVKELGENDDVLTIKGVEWESVPGYTCAFGHRVRGGVSGGFGWRPDGRALVYSRRSDTSDGQLLNDLYEYDLDSEKEHRLSNRLRASSPTYSPDGRRVVFVSQSDGTTNLWVRDVEGGDARPVTRYRDGSQASDPTWDPAGEMIYFTRSARSGKGIYRVPVEGGEPEAVVDSDADERNPALDADGSHLYFASDETGIFNIYRLALGDPAGVDALPITNVLGGAFMPDIGRGGELVFSSYDWDGYKIALLRSPEPLATGRATAYAAPAVTRDLPPAGDFKGRSGKLGSYDDSDLGPLSGAELEAMLALSAEAAADDSGASGTEGEGGRGVGERSVATTERFNFKPYKSAFTSFQFFPVFRLDHYVSRRRSPTEVRLNERSAFQTFMRNTKVGFYAVSREVLDGLSFSAGFLVGPFSGSVDSFGDYVAPSSLLKLERDIFVQFDYTKGFGSARWSPQFTFELFNIRRNVENALAIEEFSCTACYPPDTTLADVSYNLWEMNFAVRSKVTRSLVLEAGIRFNPYRATTESFYSTELQQTIPAVSSRYYIGRAFRLKAYYEAFRAYRDADIVPEGLRVVGEYEFEPGRLLDRFTVEDGLLTPKYEEFRNHRLTLDARIGMRLPFRLSRGTHGIGLRARGSTILGDPVDSFFNDFIGGLIGARGYPFYALGGNSTIWLQGSYFVPILPAIRKQLLFLYFDKIYARIYADAAMAWSGPMPGTEAIRKGVGAELRLAVGSFYLLPTAVFLSATYGFDQFAFELDEGFVTPDGSNTVLYGETVQWHFGVLFGFDL